MDLQVIALLAALSAWLLLLVEGFVLLALARQIGVLHARIRPRGAFDTGREGPSIGARLVEVRALTDKGDDITIGAATERPVFHLFVSPVCALCRDVLTALNAFHHSVNDRVDLRVLVRGESADVGRIRERHSIDRRIPIITAPHAFERYGISTTPWMLVSGSDGRVMSRGIVNDLEQMEVVVEGLFPPNGQGVSQRRLAAGEAQR